VMGTWFTLPSEAEYDSEKTLNPVVETGVGLRGDGIRACAWRL